MYDQKKFYAELKKLKARRTYKVSYKKTYIKTGTLIVTADNEDDAYDAAQDQLKDPEFVGIRESNLRRDPDFDEIVLIPDA